MKELIFIFLLISSGISFSQTTNEKIVSFVESKVGKKVGDGVCHTLIKKALNKSNSSIDKYKRAASNKEGMYGFRKDSLDVIPGDIMIFSGAKFVKDGYVTYSRFHGAIVIEVVVPGVEFLIAHQNTKGSLKESIVVTEYRNLNNKVKGKVKFYSPR